MAAAIPEPSDHSSGERRFTSTARLLGDVGMRRLAQSTVLVAGIGGVGSWAAEALARSGVGCIVLVDLDHVAESNINRQVHALLSTVGAAKVEVMRERIGQIAPGCVVHAIDEFVDAANAAALVRDAAGRVARVDAIVDAVDQVRAKAALLAAAVAQRRYVVSCGAAGGRRDPLRLRVDDLSVTTGDALLASLRARLRREHGFPAAKLAEATAQSREGGVRKRKAARLASRFGIEAIHSSEPSAGQPDGATTGSLACAGYGSIVTVTAAMGLAAAARAIDAITSMTVDAPPPSGPR